MSRRVQNGKWFYVATEEQHKSLKRYGKVVPPKPDIWSACVQIGEWVGPGKYMLMSYTQRCPRNCCDDSVFEVLTVNEVIELVRDEMRELAYVLKQAKEQGNG